MFKLQVLIIPQNALFTVDSSGCGTNNTGSDNATNAENIDNIDGGNLNNSRSNNKESHSIFRNYSSSPAPGSERTLNAISTPILPNQYGLQRLQSFNPNNSLVTHPNLSSYVQSNLSNNFRIKKFLHITYSNNRLETIAHEISQRFLKLYPNEEPLQILNIQNFEECDLDPDYTAEMVFDNNNVCRVIVANEFNEFDDAIINNNGKRHLAGGLNSVMKKIRKPKQSQQQNAENTFHVNSSIWSFHEDSPSANPHNYSSSRNVLPYQVMNKPLGMKEDASSAGPNISLAIPDVDDTVIHPHKSQHLKVASPIVATGSPTRITSGMLNVHSQPDLSKVDYEEDINGSMYIEQDGKKASVSTKEDAMKNKSSKMSSSAPLPKNATDSSFMNNADLSSSSLNVSSSNVPAAELKTPESNKTGLLSMTNKRLTPSDQSAEGSAAKKDNKRQKMQPTFNTSSPITSTEKISARLDQPRLTHQDTSGTISASNEGSGLTALRGSETNNNTTEINETLDVEKAMREKTAKEKAIKEKAEKVAEAKAAKEKMAKEKAERAANEKAAKEKAAKEKAEKVAKAKAEKEKLAKQKAEKAAKAKAEKERLAKEKIEKAAKVKAEKERLAKERAEKAAKAKAEKEKIAKEKAEKAAKEKAEKAAKEKAEKERTAKEKAAKELAIKEKIAKEKAEKERLTREEADERKKEETKKNTTMEETAISTADKIATEVKPPKRSRRSSKNSEVIIIEATPETEKNARILKKPPNAVADDVDSDNILTDTEDDEDINKIRTLTRDDTPEDEKLNHPAKAVKVTKLSVTPAESRSQKKSFLAPAKLDGNPVSTLGGGASSLSDVSAKNPIASSEEPSTKDEKNSKDKGDAHSVKTISKLIQKENAKINDNAARHDEISGDIDMSNILPQKNRSIKPDMPKTAKTVTVKSSGVDSSLASSSSSDSTTDSDSDSSSGSESSDESSDDESFKPKVVPAPKTSVKASTLSQQNTEPLKKLETSEPNVSSQKSLSQSSPPKPAPYVKPPTSSISCNPTPIELSKRSSLPRLSAFLDKKLPEVRMQKKPPAKTESAGPNNSDSDSNSSDSSTDSSSDSSSASDSDGDSDSDSDSSDSDSKDGDAAKTKFINARTANQFVSTKKSKAKTKKNKGFNALMKDLKK